MLAEGKISPAIDIYEVYKSLFRGESPEGAHRAYCDPDSFFRITYVTPSFRQYLEDFLRKLAAGESQIYTLPALLGAGKSHFLALVLHVLALYGKCKGLGSASGGTWRITEWIYRRLPWLKLPPSLCSAPAASSASLRKG